VTVLFYVTASTTYSKPQQHSQTLNDISWSSSLTCDSRALAVPKHQ